MGMVVEIKSKTLIKQWIHKLFNCPTFWKSLWTTFWKSEPYYKCPKCKKDLHCYWDGNDTKEGIDFCNECASKIK